MLGRFVPHLLVALIIGLPACPGPSETTTPTNTEVDCAKRTDRDDLGSPLHRESGGKGGLRARLPNGVLLDVMRTKGDWNLVRVTGSKTTVIT